MNKVSRAAGSLLMPTSNLGQSRNSAMPKADVTNAPELFGDPNMDEGDPDDMTGDPNLYGDPSLNDATIALYKVISGDPRITPRTKHILRNVGLLTGAGAATALGIKQLQKLYQRRKANKARIAGLVHSHHNHQSMALQSRAQHHPGVIDRWSLTPFFQLTGAKMNASPIVPLSNFPADSLKGYLDRQNSDTPFLQETEIGTFAAGTWTITATGAATPRFYFPLILTIGINELTGTPGIPITVNFNMPTIQTPLVTAQPFIFTITKGYDVRFLIYPWNLVANKPIPILGQYSNANPITCTITGLPGTGVNCALIVPGSEHPWVIGVRNAIANGSRS